MKKLLLASVLSAMVSVANAGVVALPSGVSFIAEASPSADAGVGNYTSPFNFVQWWDDVTTATNGDSLSTFNLLDESIYSNNYELKGLGELGNTNSTDPGTLTCGSCEITFQFGGIGLIGTDISNPEFVAEVARQQLFIDAGFVILQPGETATSIVRDAGQIQELLRVPTIDISNGYLNVYVDYSGNDYQNSTIDDDNMVTAAEIESAADPLATPFLKLKFTQIAASVFNSNDGVFGLSVLDTFFGLEVAGNDVATGGTAYKNFNTQGVRSLQNGIVNFADAVGLGLSASFGQRTPGVYDTFATSNRTGSISGFAVSAPSTIAFMGLGLFGLAFAARRRNK